MKEVYLLRHGEKDVNGVLTEYGQRAARDLGRVLPDFSKVLTSDSSRTKWTARLLSNQEPEVDPRAGFYMATQEKSDAINELAAAKGITFFEAADLYNDDDLLEGIAVQAKGLNGLVDETLSSLDEGERALIVSHDMTITPAMVMRGQPRESIPYLSGYVIDESGNATKYTA